MRSTTAALSRLLELLELEQPRVVTRHDIEDMAGAADVRWPTNVVVQRLRERGWLLDLKTRGVWEFAPAARAGAYGAGDPLIELRATLARRRDAAFAVAAESAAYLLGYASRGPQPEVVSVPAGVTVPPALRDYRVVRWAAQSPLEQREDLPVWGAATLLAFMATRPSQYHDWPNVGEWIARAVAAASPEDLRAELRERPRSAWARAAYLLAVGGQEARGSDLLSDAPSGTGPYFLGPRGGPGRHAMPFEVIDSIGIHTAMA